MITTAQRRHNKVEFLIDQLHLFSKQNHGQHYDVATTKTARFLYLLSKNCYQASKKYLNLPQPNAIKSYFRSLGTPSSVTEHRNTVATVFNKLSGTEKYCKVLLDEIHMKPVVRYQGNYMTDFSHGEPTKAAKTVLAIMIAPMIISSHRKCFVTKVFLIISQNSQESTCARVSF